jgi:hypothetical protein
LGLFLGKGRNRLMRTPTSHEPSLANSILDQIESVVQEAEQAGRPLEIDPYRPRLFELFVMADAGDLLKESTSEEEPKKLDLTSDGLCRALAERWNLSDAVRQSNASQTRLPPAHLARMRLLWSVMRMWMEWTYAWQRWAEFHQGPKDGPPAGEA